MIHSLPLLPHYTVGAPAVRALPSSAHLTILPTISMTPKTTNNIDINNNLDMNIDTNYRPSHNLGDNLNDTRAKIKTTESSTST